MEYTFKKYQASLRAKKYNQLPQEELNSLVINKSQLDLVVNSCQRLIVKVLSKKFRFTAYSDDQMMEFVSVANEALADAINVYKDDKIDFALFAYYHILNYLRTYIKFEMATVKSRTIDKERHIATYFYLDDQSREEEEVFEVEYVPYVPANKIDLERIYSYLIEKKSPIKRKAFDMYIDYTGLSNDFKMTSQEVAEKYGVTYQNVIITVHRVINKMKENEKVVKYLSQFVG